MWKLHAVLVSILAVLVVIDWRMTSSEREARSASSQVRQLIPPEKRIGKDVAAIRIEDPVRKETLVFVRQKESWRCLSRYGALCDEGKVRNLLEGLFAAQGIVQSRMKGRAGDYGLSYGSTIILSLHGAQALKDPQGDRIAAVEIGASIPGGSGGCYVRLPGKEEVVAIDADLRADLSPPPEAPDLPPLVDPHLVPLGWPGKGGIARIRIERAGGEKVELVRRDKELDPQAMKSGQVPWDWMLVRDGAETPADQALANSYTSYLRRATFAAVLDPKAPAPPGLAAPAAKLVLSPPEGEGMEILVGTKGAGDRARTPVKNGVTGMVVEMAPEAADLLAPQEKGLTDPAGGNPWDALLRKDVPQLPEGISLPGR